MKGGGVVERQQPYPWYTQKKEEGWGRGAGGGVVGDVRPSMTSMSASKPKSGKSPAARGHESLTTNNSDHRKQRISFHRQTSRGVPVKCFASSVVRRQ